MTTTILTIGESLVDVVDVPADDGSPILVEHPGGSPMNIAVGAARLGLPVTLLTAIGPDDRGASIVQHLEVAGVDIAPASFRDEPTSSATAHLQSDGSARYDFDIRWSLPAGLELAPADIVHVGSIAAFIEPGGSSVAELLRALTDDGRAALPLITFDPNMRPSIVTDHEDASARFAEIASLAAVVKLSDEDAAWLYPGATLDEAIDRILGLGPALVAVTRGGDGAVLATAGERLAVPGEPVQVADTIGAGDSFMSALIFGVGQALDTDVAAEALRDGTAFTAERLARIGAFAVRCAAVTVSRPGANPPTLAEVDG